jgi:Sulfotransferase family
MPPLPLVLRLTNRAGGALRRIGVPIVSLDCQVLLDRAARNTGLDDFGGGAFLDGFRRLLDSYENEARLTVFGRIVARTDALRLLENRLRMADTIRRHPEILAGAIRAPIFILGLPRTGTTILHELMAQDPANRVPMTWEVQLPWPPPERETYDSDPRIAAVEKHFAGIDRVLPGFKAMHPMGALLPQECVALTAHDFATMIYHTTHNVPSYQAWLERTDLRPVYASHRRQLQYLQWRCAADRWVLKSPGHLWAIDALLHEYPDARIVQTHRDPLKVIASLTSLICHLRSLATDHIDRFEIGSDWTARLAAGLDKAMVERDRLVPPERAYDVQFGDFVGNEIETVRKIYAHFHLDLSGEAERRMRRFLAENPKDKHGAHRYALERAGLDRETERRRYAAYARRFAVAEES